MEIDYMNRHVKYYLDRNWKFALHNPSDKLLANEKINIHKGFFYKAQVPGTLHTDLMNNDIIEDPFFADNENNLIGIDESDWMYLTEFNLTQPDEDYQIVFDGLDTISEIILNDKLVGRTDNMFCTYRFDINDFIHEGKNELKIIFRSPTIYSKKEEDKYGRLDVALNSSRVYIRKAQYSYGWDWGPILTTSGIWKDIP